MKKLANLHMMALALVFTVLSGTSVFAADPSNALNEDSHLLSTSDFKVLSGLSANPMNEAELDEVQGKYRGSVIQVLRWDNPLCWVDGCGGPGPLFRLIDPVSLRDATVALEKVRGVNPEPQPWKSVISSPIPLPWKDLSEQVIF